MVPEIDCVFCKIVRRELPSTVVHEEEDFLVFENTHRTRSGQNLLIIPKDHVSDYVDSDPKYFLRVFQIVRVLKEKLKLTHFFLKTNYKAPYQTVFHAHFHLRSGFMLNRSGNSSVDDDVYTE